MLVENGYSAPTTPALLCCVLPSHAGYVHPAENRLILAKIIIVDVSQKCITREAQANECRYERVARDE
jgi:hypothetical protein